jgi:hypothetical protein
VKASQAKMPSERIAPRSIDTTGQTLDPCLLEGRRSSLISSGALYCTVPTVPGVRRRRLGGVSGCVAAAQDRRRGGEGRSVSGAAGGSRTCLQPAHSV